MIVSNQAGSAPTIECISNGDFNAIVYGEFQRYYWVAGSGSGVHTVRNPTPGYKQAETHAKVQIAITYTNVNGYTCVRLYRDGIKFGDYTQKEESKFIQEEILRYSGVYVTEVQVEVQDTWMLSLKSHAYMLEL